MSKKENSFEINGRTFTGNPEITLQVMDAFQLVYGLDLNNPSSLSGNLNIASGAVNVKAFAGFTAVITREAGEQFDIITDSEGKFVRFEFLSESLADKAHYLYSNISAANIKEVADFFTKGWIPNIPKSGTSSQSHKEKRN